MNIRKAIITDIPTLAGFQVKLAFESEGIVLDEAILRKGMRALIEDATKGTYYIAESEGVAIGCHMITYEWSDWRNGMVLWIQSVYVAEDQRKNGVFRKMYDALAERVRTDPGLIGIRLYVDKTNARAQKVYDAMGMNGSHYTVYEWMKS